MTRRVTTTRVRELRRSETQAEKAAWQLFRNRRAGVKFHRQYPLGNYVVDFYCCELRMAVELDGGAHSQPSQMRRGQERDAHLKSIGIRVLRVPNGLVLEDPNGFVDKVRQACLK